MSTLNLTFTGLAQSFTGGSAPFGGQGESYTFTISGTWVNGDQYTISLNDTTSSYITQIGAGYVTGAQPTFLMTYNNKVYSLAGPTVFTSALNQPTIWNDPNGIGNGFVTMSDYYNIQENLVAVAPFQGRLAFFSPYTIQLWVVDPLIVNWQQVQVLTNIGTSAPLSVQGLGDFDVLFLNNSGVRSLRVLSTTLQGYISDIGSPIDEFIQNIISTNGLASIAGACSVVDPLTRRYWCFIPNSADPNGVGKIYVLSYYPGNKIQAWATYDPSYISAGSPVYFTPKLFNVYNGQVWVVDSNNNIYVYGGTSGNTYDAIPATIQTSFLDLKRPGDSKLCLGIDFDVSSISTTWAISASSDWIDGTFDPVVSAIGQASFDQGWIGYQAKGTHFSIQATTTDASAATLASAILYYNLADSPG